MKSSWAERRRRWALTHDEFVEAKVFCTDRKNDPEIRLAIEQTVKERAEIGRFLYLHVTEGIRYMYLQVDGLELGYKAFVMMRSEFYWRLSSVIKYKKGRCGYIEEETR